MSQADGMERVLCRYQFECLEGNGTTRERSVGHFDGQMWEMGIGQLAWFLTRGLLQRPSRWTSHRRTMQSLI